MRSRLSAWRLTSHAINKDSKTNGKIKCRYGSIQSIAPIPINAFRMLSESGTSLIFSKYNLHPRHSYSNLRALRICLYTAGPSHGLDGVGIGWTQTVCPQRKTLFVIEQVVMPIECGQILRGAAGFDNEANLSWEDQ